MDVLHSERRSSSALLPKIEAGQGVGYILKNWTELPRYSADPDLAIDNNHTERSLKLGQLVIMRFNDSAFLVVDQLHQPFLLNGLSQ
jgi:hypothetical protein